jgi:Protein of unknown function (DUF1822)
MLTDGALNHPTSQPNPGEIWEINHLVDSPRSSPCQQTVGAEHRQLGRYGIIVREPQQIDPTSCSVMLLSVETQFSSSIDVLIPPRISGLDRDLLAETWNIGSLSIDNLIQRVGNRLSRQIYDLLLSIGDADRELSIETPSISSAHLLGLELAPDRSRCNTFHQREQVWLQSFNPIVIAQATRLVELAAEIERESTFSVRIQTTLSQWFQQIVEPQWQDAQQFERGMAISIRSLVIDDESTATISKLKFSDDQAYRCQLIKRLGSIGSNNQDALATIAELVQTTQDDQTLWTAVSSLYQLDPVHPNLGIRKLQSIDLGVTINFVVNIIPKENSRFGILLQVYPDQSALSLPANLKLILQDELGNSLREVISQPESCCLQLKLSGVAREIFSVCLELDGVQSIVDFVI